MALILLADHISCQCLFPDDEPLKVEQISRYLHSNKAVDVSERAYEWVINWVSRNANRFSPDAAEVYGKLESDHVVVNKDVLLKAMSESGYEYNAVSRKWAEKGYLLKTKQGKTIHRTTINGVPSNVVKISFQREDEGISGIDVTNEVSFPEEFM